MPLTGPLLAIALTAVPAATDPRIADLALCRESWLEWKTSDPARLANLAAFLQSNFLPGRYDSLAPKSAMSVAGLRVTNVLPDSVGMGVGFSVLVEAPFDATRRAVERELGRPFHNCEASDGTRSCELELGPQRTVTVAADVPQQSRTTLIGCFYVYEK